MNDESIYDDFSESRTSVTGLPFISNYNKYFYDAKEKPLAGASPDWQFHSLPHIMYHTLQNHQL